MRCKACNKALTQFEATRKSKSSNEFIDLCNDCYSFVKEESQVVERYDLMDVQDEVDNEDFF